jgi:hypothetical protein
MGYNKRGYANNYFTTKSNEKWAIYQNSTDGILDRFAWDKKRGINNPIESKNIDEYIHRCSVFGYWVESGRDRGYSKLLYDKLDKYNNTFETLILLPPVAIATTLLLFK